MSNLAQVQLLDVVLDARGVAVYRTVPKQGPPTMISAAYLSEQTTINCNNQLLTHDEVRNDGRDEGSEANDRHRREAERVRGRQSETCQTGEGVSQTRALRAASEARVSGGQRPRKTVGIVRHERWRRI